MDWSHALKGKRIFVSIVVCLGLSLLAVSPVVGQDLVVGDDMPAVDLSEWVVAPMPYLEAEAAIFLWWSPTSVESLEALELLELVREVHPGRVAVNFVSPDTQKALRATLREMKLLEHIQVGVISDHDSSFRENWVDASRAREKIPAFVVGPSGRIEAIGNANEIAFATSRILEGSWDPYLFVAWRNQTAFLEYQLFSALKLERPWEQVLANLDSLVALHQTFPDFADTRSYRLERFIILANELGDVERAYSYARAQMISEWGDALHLNNLAWVIADEADLERRELDLALELSVRSNELTNYKVASHLDTLARIYFEQGDIQQAIQWQELAVERCSPDDQQFEFIKGLSSAILNSRRKVNRNQQCKKSSVARGSSRQYCVGSNKLAFLTLHR